MDSELGTPIAYAAAMNTPGSNRFRFACVFFFAAAAACGDPAPSASVAATDGGGEAAAPPVLVDAGATDARTPVPPEDAGAGLASAQAQEDAHCAALATRAACPGKSAKACTSEERCRARALAPAAARAYAACFGSPSCKFDDACGDEAAMAAAGQKAADYSAQCTVKLDACGGPKHDACATTVFAYVGVGEAAAACLARPCAEFHACHEAAVAAVASCKGT